MKRNVIFIIVLFLLLTAIVSAERIYTNDFKRATGEIIDNCGEQRVDYIDCADKLYSLMNKRKAVNRLFYSKDITHQVINEAKKLKVYAEQNELSDAKASVETLRFLFKSMCRFNENKG